MTYDIERLVTQITKVKPSDIYKLPGSREAILRILGMGWKIVAFRPVNRTVREYFIPTGTSAVNAPWQSGSFSTMGPRFIVEATVPPEFPEWE